MATLIILSTALGAGCSSESTNPNGSTPPRDASTDALDGGALPDAHPWIDGATDSPTDTAEDTISTDAPTDTSDASDSALDAPTDAPLAGCSVPGGANIAHGQSIVRYRVAQSVDCARDAETRACNNGTLSGSATKVSCSDDPTMYLSPKGPLDKWWIGVNEPLIQEYIMQQGVACPACPSNMVPRSLAVTKPTLLDLASKQHMGTYREIVSFVLLAPGSQGDSSNFEKLIDVIKVYEGYNLRLVLAPGAPLPGWMLVTNSSWGIMPADDGKWKTLSGRMAETLSRFVQYMWDSPRISKKWLRERFMLDGFNEFDGIMQSETAGDYSRNTPERAAHYQKDLLAGLTTRHMPVQVLAPSIVGVFPLGASSVGQQYATYLKRYYAAGGTGEPNIHVYPNEGTAAGDIALMSAAMPVIDGVLPARWKRRTAITEIGAADIGGQCLSSSPGSKLSIQEREAYYVGLVQDPTVSKYTQMVLFWRLMNLPAGTVPSSPCEQNFGLMHDDASGYKGVGTKLFSFLNTP